MRKNMGRLLAVSALAMGLVWIGGTTPALAKDKVSLGVPPGYRALPVPVGNHVAQYLKKGDRVDMLVTFDAQFEDVKEKVTATILQNVLVLDVRPGSEDMEATLLLTLNPREAMYTALSLVLGTVAFIVRGEGDLEMKPMEMSSFRKLFK